MPVEWVMDASRVPMIAVGMNGEPLAPRPRLPGSPHRARPVRLRLGDEVADRAPAHAIRPVSRLLGAPRLGRARPDPHPVADRRPVLRSAAQGGLGADRRRRLGARPRDPRRRGSARRRGVVAGDALRARSRRRPGSSGCSDGMPTPGSHRISVRAIDGTGEVQTDLTSRPAPDGARGHHTISVNVA